jgi:hypothetical protein
MSDLNPLAGSTGAEPTPAPTPQAPVETAAEASWLDKYDLPTDIKGHPSLKPIKDEKAALISYVNAQKLIGAEKIPLPSKYATKEEKREYVYKKLGLPDTVENYSITPGENSVVDKGFLDAFKKTAWENNVLPDQAQELVKWFEGYAKAATESLDQSEQKRINEELSSLQEEWGKSAPSRFQRASNAVKEIGDRLGFDAPKFFNENPTLGRNPVLIKMFDFVAEHIMQDKLAKGDSGGLNYVTPDAALRKANAILADRNHPYNLHDHPDHGNAVRDVQQYFEAAYPTQQTNAG